MSRFCKVCHASEQTGAPFPKFGLLCSACYNERERQRYQDNKEYIKAQKRQYTIEHKAHIAQRSARYHQEHKEFINAKNRREYAEKERPQRPCLLCFAPMPKRAQKYCAQCKEKMTRERAKLRRRKLRMRKEHPYEHYSNA